MVSRWAVVDEEGNTVNVIIWDGETEFDPGEGLTLVPAEEAPPLS